MNLLLLDQFSDLGGAQQNLLELLPAMRDAGWQALVGLPGEGELFATRSRAGLRGGAHRLRAVRVRTEISGGLRYVSWRARRGWRVRCARMAQRVDADLVYLNGPRLLPAAAMAGFERPVLFHSHSYLGPGAVRTPGRACAAPHWTPGWWGNANSSLRPGAPSCGRSASR